MTEHRWSVVAIAPLEETTARKLAGMDMHARLDAIVGMLAPEGALPKVSAIRGPICSECRVSWEDFERTVTKGKPWPCPGRRPDGLGGPLYDPTTSRPSTTRQERRKRQRKAVKGAKEHPMRPAIEGRVRTAVLANRKPLEEAGE